MCEWVCGCVGVWVGVWVCECDLRQNVTAPHLLFFHLPFQGCKNSQAGMDVGLETPKNGRKTFVRNIPKCFLNQSTHSSTVLIFKNKQVSNSSIKRGCWPLTSRQCYKRIFVGIPTTIQKAPKSFTVAYASPFQLEIEGFNLNN